MHRRIALLTIPLLALSACGSQDALEPSSPSATTTQEQPSETAPEGDAEEITDDSESDIDAPAALTVGKTYEATTEEGTLVALTLDTPAPADVEALVADLDEKLDQGESNSTYLQLDVDNRDGTDEFTAYNIYVYDPNGEEYEYMPVKDFTTAVAWNLDDIVDSGTDEWTRLYDEVSAVGDAYPNSVRRSGRETVTYIGDELPAEIVDVQIDSTSLTRLWTPKA